MLHAQLTQLVDDVFLQLGLAQTESELSAVFTDDETMRRLNARWRGIDKPTNVLSFPAFAVRAGQAPQALMGDIVFALETIEREAEEQQKSFLDHLIHLMVHGILHLLGFDHQTPQEAQIMEGLERKILAHHAIADPYYSERM